MGTFEAGPHGEQVGDNSPMNPTLEVDGREQKLKGPLPDLLTTAAIRFVRENRHRPFALCLHFHQQLLGWMRSINDPLLRDE
jgi:hypothetical protein